MAARRVLGYPASRWPRIWLRNAVPSASQRGVCPWHGGVRALWSSTRHSLAEGEPGSAPRLERLKRDRSYMRNRLSRSGFADHLQVKGEGGKVRRAVRRARRVLAPRDVLCAWTCVRHMVCPAVRSAGQAPRPPPVNRCPAAGPARVRRAQRGGGAAGAHARGPRDASWRVHEAVREGASA